MLGLSRGSLIGACLLAAVILQPAGLVAKESGQGSKSTGHTAPAAKAAESNMPGCADSVTGACCSACQEKSAQAQKGKSAAPANCPCRHAKKRARKHS